ncbi:hypothetical protein C7212DRAFT_343825 [Tuber magnatum]|uniref:Uncharacterized protein n=1 Tax=Tuber magnatum TaxID=42249 RepID=A0A317SRF1_9PEZI|nr:hypothetical protein C7212DRAFT_343825 [Tuber magnatum]
MDQWAVSMLPQLAGSGSVRHEIPGAEDEADDEDEDEDEDKGKYSNDTEYKSYMPIRLGLPKPATPGMSGGRGVALREFSNTTGDLGKEECQWEMEKHRRLD